MILDFNAFERRGKPPTEDDILDRVSVPMPWCTCKGMGALKAWTRRADGAWVKPCCGRPTKSWHERWGDQSVDSSRSIEELLGLIEALRHADRLYPMAWNRVRIEELEREVASRRPRSVSEQED